MNKTTLLVLAAGLGSRYKGQKQIDSISAQEEALMEFGLYDAAKLGFKKFVFIINDQFPEEYKDHLVEVLSRNKKEVHFVEQTKDRFIPDEYLEKLEARKKPLGTAHAVYCAKDIINEPFVTINADDFYGRKSYEVAFKAVQDNEISKDRYAMVAFELINTLSENGTVSRGVSDIEGGMLKGVEEHTAIEKTKEGISGLNENEEKKELKEDTLVSMNFWILDPSYFEFAKRDLVEFLEENEDVSSKEFYLPSVIDKAIQQNEVAVKVLSSSEKWFGLTYQRDKDTAKKEIKKRKENGAYPKKLWD